MQEFNLDLSKKLIQPLLNAKQGEVGRKFRAVITDAGAEYQIPANAAFSIWYSGAGGEGNYTDIGDRSAFNIEGNKVTVELITQMLNLPGKGELCLTMDVDDTTISTWNIPYLVEAVPGMGSKEATHYFNILKESAERAAASAAEAKQAASSFEAVAIVCDAEGELITLKDASDFPLVGLKIYGKTTQNGTPTPDAPVALVSVGDTVEIAVYGKNLLDTEATFEKAQDVTGITKNVSGTTLSLSGTPTAAYWQSSTTFISVPKDWRGKRMRFGATLSGNQPNTLIYFRKSATPSSSDLLSTIGLSGSGNVSKTFTVPDEATYCNIVFCLNQGTTGSAFTATYSDMYLSDAEAEDGYEQYKGRQTLSVPTPNGLPGIPVSSGGNYTDENGQQWLAHIAGYEQNGRIGELETTGYIESYAGEAIPGAYLSSTGSLDVGAAVRYALGTPVFTPYDADTQAQWEALHTNKPNTTIYNDAGIGMEVSYVADTKTYIDNKFAELAAAIVNNT